MKYRRKALSELEMMMLVLYAYLDILVPIFSVKFVASVSLLFAPGFDLNTIRSDFSVCFSFRRVIMGFSTHPLVVILERGNYESWAKGILTHCRWLNFLPYLYDLIPEPATSEGKLAWDIIRDHIVELIVSSVDHDTVLAISDIDCPHPLWTRLWEIYGDPNLSPFLEDPASDCLIPISWRENTPFDHDTLEELEYLDTLTCSNGSEACLTGPTLQIETSSASPVAPDSVQQEIIHLPDIDTLDSYVADISFLFVESYTTDLEDYFEDIHLLYLDSQVITVFPPLSMHSMVSF
jgi:hypothetical protein